VTSQYTNRCTNHYEVLGVEPDVDQAEIRRAYHRAARRWHPDRFASSPAAAAEQAEQAEQEMRRVNEAWEVLGDRVSRRIYDQRDRNEPGPATHRQGIRVDDGVTRIDPRLLDPTILASRRHAQYREISARRSMVVRATPVVALLVLLTAIFVFTAYTRSDGGATIETTAPPGPNLGAGIEGGDCVSVLTGPSLIARPCDATAEWRVIGARLPDGACPLGTTQELELSNGAIACLAPPA
jgi:hypothetical protein